MLNRTLHGHTPSVAHVQAQNKVGRRTLGVKRSVDGWAARGRGKGGFAVLRGGGGAG